MSPAIFDENIDEILNFFLYFSDGFQESNDWYIFPCLAGKHLLGGKVARSDGKVV